MVVKSEIPNVSCSNLKELWLHITHKCNLSCSHCLFTCSPDKDANELTLEECQSYIVEAIKNGAQEIYITGGEPLIWADLKNLLDWYYKLDTFLPLTILTNGTLITSEWAMFFSAHKSKGLNIRVSLECYTKENNDSYRGEGSFSKSITGIKHLNNHNIKPWIAYVDKSISSPCAHASLEKDFATRLKADFGIEISGVKIITAYSKGRFAGQVNFNIDTITINNRLKSVQCNYGVAAAKGGFYPCPILVDVPAAILSQTLADAVGQEFSLEYEYCNGCLTTNTSCGNSGAGCANLT